MGASGQGRPAETRAARSAMSKDLPVPGSPMRRVSLPRGMRAGQSQRRGSDSISLAKRKAA